MSDNRFQDCHTVAQALRRYRDMEVVDADDDFELTVRLHQLAPKVPRTVTAEQRERVRKIVSGWVDGMQCHTVTDRIIDALGYTVAPKPVVDEGARERARRVVHDWIDEGSLGRSVAHSDGDTLVTEIIDALGWPAADPEQCGTCDGVKCMACRSRHHHDECEQCCPTPTPATPAVELDAANLLRFARALKAFETLDPDPDVMPGPDDGMTITICGVTAVARLNEACQWVLRIGGEQ